MTQSKHHSRLSHSFAIITLGVLTCLVASLVPARAESLAEQVEAARKEVARLETKAHEEHPELTMLEKMERDATALYEDEHYRAVQKETLAYVDQIKHVGDLLSQYQTMRHAYRAIVDYDVCQELLADKTLRPIVLEFCRAALTERDKDIASMTDTELETYIMSAMKEDADQGQDHLRKARQVHDWPPYVVEYARLWAEAENRQGGTWYLLTFKTPKELADARERLYKLEIQFKDASLSDAEQAENKKENVL